MHFCIFYGLHQKLTLKFVIYFPKLTVQIMRHQFLRCRKCAIKCGKHYVPYEVLRMIQMGYARLEHGESQSLLKKILTRDMLDRLKRLKTPKDTNLYDCIQTGFENFDAKIGVYAGDPDAYFVFAELFNRILEEFHGFGPRDRHPRTCWGHLDDGWDIDPNRLHVLTTRMRVSRNLFGYPFVSMMTPKDFLRIEEQVTQVLNLLTGQHEGYYASLSELDADVQKDLVEEGLLFDDRDKFLRSARAYNHWPQGRGIYLNHHRNFCVWINEEDHVKIATMEMGGAVSGAYQRLVRGVKKLEQDLPFLESERLGYVTFCPSNVGTAFKISMNVRLPVQATRPEELVQYCDANGLMIANLDEETGPNPKGFFKLCNAKKAGWTEEQTVQFFVGCVSELIENETRMQRDFHLLMSSGKYVPA